MRESCDIKYLVRVGMGLEKLQSVLDDDIWDNLSKHSTYWDSAHEKEADKLDSVRMKLSFLNESLWEVVNCLKSYEEDES